MEKQSEMLESEVGKLINIDDIDSLRTTKEIDDAIAKILLFQKDHPEAGIPLKHHSEQTSEVLKNTEYWNISNLLQLLELKRRLINQKLVKFNSFTGGGSIGVGYLGNMLNDYENGKFADVVFGYSAGSLFPAIFLLYKKAREINPEKIGTGIESIFNILPKGLDGKDMFFNGEELIEAFVNISKNLIDIINEKLPDDKKLPDIYNITIDDLSKNFKIIANRRYDGSIQEVIFGGKDKLLSSVIASSSPEINILGFNFNILTSEKNKFYSNEWIDGFSSDLNLINYSNLLGIYDKKESATLEHYSKKGKYDTNYLGLVDVFYVPSLNNFLNGDSSNDYSMMNQISNWGYNDMKLKVIMGYYKKLSYSNIGFFLENIEKNINDENVFIDIIDAINSDGGFYYDVGDFNYIAESIDKIKNLKFLNQQQKQKLILKVFYKHTDKTTNDTGVFYETKYDFLGLFLPRYYDKNLKEIISKNQISISEMKLNYIDNIYPKQDKIILGLFASKEELLQSILSSNNYNFLLIGLFKDTNLLNDININHLIHSLLYYTGVGFEFENLVDNIREKLLKLGRFKDEKNFREFLEKSSL